MPVLLIEELSPTQGNIIEEATTDGKNLWLSGVFMQADIKNRNGRVYPLTEISKAVTEAQPRIKDNQLMGELDHPQTLTINLDRVSHLITEIGMSGGNAVGKLKLLNTPMGNIAKTLIESGVRPGVSSRGAGNVDDDGNVSEFMFTTIDLVATPSAPGAIPQSMYESLEMIKSGRNAMTLAEQVVHDPSAQKYLKREILKFLNDITHSRNK